MSMEKRIGANTISEENLQKMREKMKVAPNFHIEQRDICGFCKYMHLWWQTNTFSCEKYKIWPLDICGSCDDFEEEEMRNK